MSAIKPVRDTDSSSSLNDNPGVTMPHPNETDLAADLFAAALRATEVMVRTAALKSMPQGRFIPKFELAAWSEADIAVCAAKFEDAVRAVVTEEIAALVTDAIVRAA